jgi:hypothetical protein
LLVPDVKLLTNASILLPSVFNVDEKYNRADTTRTRLEGLEVPLGPRVPRATTVK